MATYRLAPSPAEDGIVFQVLSKPLLGGERVVAVEQWGRIDARELTMPIARLIAWADEQVAARKDDHVTVPHGTIADLSDREARALGLPPPPSVQLQVQCEGTIDQPEFRLRHGWRAPGGQWVAAARRIGCWLQIGSAGAHRLPAHMFCLIKAIDAFNSTARDDDAGRWRAWAAVRALLPDDGAQGVAPDTYLTSFRIVHGSAFGIDPQTIGGAFDVDPVLYAAGAGNVPLEGTGSEAQPLLPPAQHERFVKQRFRQAERCRARYTLDDGVYLVLDPEVQAGLEVVRQVQLAEPATRRDFVRNPRAYLRKVLGEAFDEAVIEGLFVETAAYSERVRDVGLWVPRVLPWVSREPGRWFPDRPEGPALGLTIGDLTVPIPPDELPGLAAEIATARQRGDASVNYRGTAIPATAETEQALKALRDGAGAGGATAPQAEPLPSSDGSGSGRQVLIIEPNLDEVGYVRRVARRDDAGADAAPTALQTALKDHQKAGLDWLLEAWRGGAPGVLLADDMGLGKTLQALAFLEWLRRVQGRAGDHRPFLVVAPTSLLETWVMEHDYHLQPPGLGEPLKVWGRGLAALRTNGGRGSALDRFRLGHASWLLTTYETLRDYHQSLAVVPFAAAIFDEVQKIKNPGALATEAAKAINADFVIGLSGTPVENRLADLWSIFDRVHEGFLGDLKAFSGRYERHDTPQESLLELKAKIERPLNGLPPPMLRRMKHEHLPGLPPKTERVRARPMPEVQAQAYGRAIEVARGQARGDVLRALHEIRSVSLHPLGADEATDGRFITASARWQVTFEILHEIAGQGEKVLIFLEVIELQPVLAALIQKTFGLERQPLIINGQLAGAQRQQRVNAFQNGAAGFDAMILGPRAAGIGLTLTAANHVIHLSRWWNPAVEDQCTDRVYRIGQHKPVTVHIPQALWPESEASSFDRRLHELLERKRALSLDLLAPPAATGADARDLFTATVGRDDN